MHGDETIMARKRFGKTFRTKAGRLGRYVYVRGKRVGFEAVREFKRQARQTYRSKYWKR